MRDVPAAPAGSRVFDGLNVAMAGSFASVNAARQVLERHGAAVSFGVTTRTDMVLLLPGSQGAKDSKLKAALRARIPIVSGRWVADCVRAGRRLPLHGSRTHSPACDAAEPAEPATTVRLSGYLLDPAQLPQHMLTEPSFIDLSQLDGPDDSEHDGNLGHDGSTSPSSTSSLTSSTTQRKTTPASSRLLFTEDNDHDSSEASTSLMMRTVQPDESAFGAVGIASSSLSQAAVPQAVPQSLTSTSSSSSSSATTPQRRFGWKTVKVFISSTFKDMHGERDHLTRVVFPELQERCERLRIHIHAIDLRWGVTGEEQPLQTCLAAVDEARPFFIGLLGDRYGWVPESYHLPTAADRERFSWLRSFPVGRSITNIEMHYGALKDIGSGIEQQQTASFYIRDPSFLSNVPQSLVDDFVERNSPQSSSNLQQLKTEIRRSGFHLFDHYPCSWRGVVDDKPMVGDLEAFGRDVLETLWRGVQNMYGQRRQQAALADHETLQHESFIESHSHGFIGRGNLLRSMEEFAYGSTLAPMVVRGEPGSGKTSLVAAFTRKLMHAGSVHVISHFVGATPGSTDIRHTLRRICTEISKHHHQGTTALDAIPEDYKELVELFAQLMATPCAAGSKPIVVVIDALNQLDNAYRAWALSWLPEELVAGGPRLIVSTLPGRVLDVLYRRRINELVVGALTVGDRQEIVTTTLAQHGKRLEPRQMQQLLEKPDAHKPLYLIIACEELRVFGVYEQLSKRIHTMAPSVPELLLEVLTRLENDHGVELVRAALSLIACSRGGVTEPELLRVLGKCHYAGEERDLEADEWGRISRSLRAFLSRSGHSDDAAGGRQITFFHEQLLIAVRRHYLGCHGAMDQSLDDSTTTTATAQQHQHRSELSDSASEFGLLQGNSFKVEMHRQLADYYERLLESCTNESYSYDGASTRAISELPYHLLKGHCWPRLHRRLCDLGFIEAKCAAGLTYDLVADFLMLREPEVREQLVRRGGGLNPVDVSSAALMLEELEQFIVFVQGRSHLLSRRPELTFSLANALPASSAPAIEATKRWNSLIETRAHLRWINKQDTADPCELTLLGHTMVARGCAYSPNARSNHAISCADDCTIRVWNVATGQELAVLRGHTKSIIWCTYSPDGSLIASAAWDKSIRLWNATTFQEVGCLRGHKGPVLSCAFDPFSGNRLVSGGHDGAVIVWELDTYHPKHVYTSSQAVLAVAWSNDGRHIASASKDGSVVVLKCNGGAGSGGDFVVRHSLGDAHSHGAMACAFAPDGRTLASTGEDRKVKMWDVASGSALRTLTGHNDNVCTCDWSPDGSKFMSGSQDNVILVWETTNWNRTAFLTGHTGTVNMCRFSPDSRRILSASFDRTIKIWSATQVVRRPSGHLARVLSVAYAPDGKRVLSGARDKTAIIWNADGTVPELTLTGHRSNVFGVAYSPNGDRVATASRDCQLMQWCAFSGTCTNVLTHESLVNGVAYSPDGMQLVSVCDDKLGRVWHARTGALHTQLFGHRDGVTCVAYSPDGKRYVTGSKDLTLKIWDAKTNRKVATLCGHQSIVHCCAFSPDGQRIVSGADNGTVIEWSAVNAKRLNSFSGHTAAVKGVAYSASGDIIVSGSTDMTVVLWDAKRGQEWCVFACMSRVTCVACSPIGSRIAVGDGSGQLYVLEPVGSARATSTAITTPAAAAAS